MFNSKAVSRYLKDTENYPFASVENCDSGLTISAENGQLTISGSPCSLIDIADLLVSLALSGGNTGQHWHLDKSTLLAENSSIGELVIGRND